MRTLVAGLLLLAPVCGCDAPPGDPPPGEPPDRPTKTAEQPAPIDPTAAKRARYEAACRRLDAVQKAGRIGTPAADLIQQAGEPTRRDKRFPVQVNGEPAIRFPANGGDEAWTYEIEDGVSVVFHIDGGRTVAGIYSTGVRFFEAELFGGDPGRESEVTDPP